MIKKCLYLVVSGILLLTVFVSCNKEEEPEIPSTTSWVWSITKIDSRVELKNQSENDSELITQIENEIKEEMALLGDVFSFTTVYENTSVGKLVRTFNESQSKITSDYLFKTNGNSRWLKIIEKNVVTDSLQIPLENNYYFTKDYTESYKNMNDRIISVLGVAYYTIPK